MRILMSTLVASFLISLAAIAAQPDIQVTGAWARASAGAATTGAAYVSLKAGEHADRLTGASTPVAQSAEVHESSMEGGVMRMRAVAGLNVPAGKTVTLRPGGYHIMMFNLRHPLAAGQAFPLTLTFDHSAPVTVTVNVRPIGAAAMSGDGERAMDHGTMSGTHMDHGSSEKSQ